MPGTAKQPEATPALNGGVVPYLMLDGAASAIDFYKRAFSAEEIGERALMDDGRILNSRVDINNGSVTVTDPMPEHGHPVVAPQAFNLHLRVDNADRWFERAAAAGCTVLMPVDLQFWGDRYGMVRDPYGVTWGLGSTPR